MCLNETNVSTKHPSKSQELQGKKYPTEHYASLSPPREKGYFKNKRKHVGDCNKNL